MLYLAALTGRMKREKYIPSVSLAVIFISIYNKQIFNDIRAGGATSKVVG
jgi:hypothetical protein